MPETLVALWDSQGLPWLIVSVFIAGLVRGFSGFGSAMIIMPVASSFMAPIEAVIFLVLVELVGPLPNLRAAWRDGARKDVGVLLIGALLGLPFGLWGLSVMNPEPFGWLVSGAVITLLIMTMTGWRFRGDLTRQMTAMAGAIGGFMTGFVAISGPPVIMLYMASKLPASVIRANFLLYLIAIDSMLLLSMIATGMMVWKIAFLGLLIGIPNLIGNFIGGWLFDPKAERVFRTVAYLIIALSAIIGLPLWKG